MFVTQRSVAGLEHGLHLLQQLPPFAAAIFGDLPAVLQTKVNERLVALLGIAPAHPEESIRQVFERAVASATNGTVNDLVNMLAQQWGI